MITRGMRTHHDIKLRSHHHHQNIHSLTQHDEGLSVFSINSHIIYLMNKCVLGK